MGGVSSITFWEIMEFQNSEVVISFHYIHAMERDDIAFTKSAKN